MYLYVYMYIHIYIYIYVYSYTFIYIHNIGFDIDQKQAARGDKNIHIDHAVFNFQTRLNDPEKGTYMCFYIYIYI
jgi:hypothetical protein